MSEFGSLNLFGSTTTKKTVKVCVMSLVITSKQKIPLHRGHFHPEAQSLV